MVVVISEVAPMVFVDAGYLAVINALVFTFGMVLGSVLTRSILRESKREMIRAIVEVLK